jgi:hypothetical protein
MSEIGGLIKKIVSSSEAVTLVAKVLDVSSSERTCTVQPLDGSPDIYDVRLQAVISGGVGHYLEPAVGSFVVICLMDSTSGAVVSTSTLSKYELVIGNTKVEVDSQGIKFASATTDVGSEVSNLIDKVNAVLDIIINIKVLGSAGPSILDVSVLPSIIQLKVELETLRSSFKTVLK